MSDASSLIDNPISAGSFSLRIEIPVFGKIPLKKTRRNAGAKMDFHGIFMGISMWK